MNFCFVKSLLLESQNFLVLPKLFLVLSPVTKLLVLPSASLGNIIFPNNTSAIRPVKQIQGHIQIHQSSLVVTDYMLDHTWCREWH